MVLATPRLLFGHIADLLGGVAGPEFVGRHAGVAGDGGAVGDHGALLDDGADGDVDLVAERHVLVDGARVEAAAGADDAVVADGDLAEQRHVVLNGRSITHLGRNGRVVCADGRMEADRAAGAQDDVADHVRAGGDEGGVLDDGVQRAVDAHVLVLDGGVHVAARREHVGQLCHVEGDILQHARGMVKQRVVVRHCGGRCAGTKLRRIRPGLRVFGCPRKTARWGFSVELAVLNCDGFEGEVGSQ